MIGLWQLAILILAVLAVAIPGVVVVMLANRVNKEFSNRRERCPDCGAENSVGANFCTKCGRACNLPKGEPEKAAPGGQSLHGSGDIVI